MDAAREKKRLNVILGSLATLFSVPAVLTAALLSGGCAMMEPKAERYVAPPLGSSWVTAQRSMGSFGTGTAQVQSTRGERVWQGKQVITFASQQGTIVSMPEGGFVAILGPGDKPLISWDPPISYEWPLTAGKTWTKTYRMTLADNRSIAYDNRCKVDAYEDVTVPAGAFKAFKVTCSTTIGDESTTWFSPELGIFVKQSQRRAANSPLGAGTRESELLSQTIRK